MPKPNLMALRSVLATVAALVAGAAWCPSAGAVVGGHDITSISQVPYQVALLRNDRSDAFSGLWCGGSIYDNYHVITAAHCLFDNALGAEGQPIAPSAIDVLAGTPRLDGTYGAPVGQRVPVAQISFDGAYNPATFSHDAAVLTLGSPLSFSNNVQPLAIAEKATWDDAWSASPATATVTGWGDRKNAAGAYVRSSYLQMGTVPLVQDADCRPAYPGFDDPAMLCAGDSQHDACFGDSGGPLVVPDALDPGLAQPKLVGIVSFGPTQACAVAGSPGGYTEVHTGTDIAAYLQQDNPPAAPRTVSPPIVQGALAVGSTVVCDPGSWDGSPSFTYQFVAPTSNGDVARTGQSSQNSYTIQPGDAGGALRCDVTGRGLGGLAFAKSTAVAVPVPQSAPPQPAPPQPTPPQPQPTQPSQQDSAAPVARVTKTTCTSTRCTLTVSVTDAGFSAGIQTVKASVKTTYRTTCTRKGTKKKVACTKTKTGRTTVSALAATQFKVVASKLPIGKQVFTLVAIDKAGHRQALPTTKTVTTKKPKKKRR